MRYAIVNGIRELAHPGLKGECPACQSDMISKCGDLKVWHWSHKGRRVCDQWWENETEWHRGWKGEFPEKWQEVIHHAPNGEKHIADVKTEEGYVIEFQHSRIHPDERRSRNEFYEKLVWVVDGTRTKRSISEFDRAWREGIPLNRNGSARKVDASKCALIMEWALSGSAVFFDFKHPNFLWWLHSERDQDGFNVVIVSRSKFIEKHIAGSFSSMVTPIRKVVSTKVRVDDPMALARAEARRRMFARRRKPRL